MKTKSQKPWFERRSEGLQEGITQTRGELRLKTIQIPDAPPEIDSDTLAAMRHQAKMSQAIFARVLSVSTKTLQSWEQGTRQPSGASLRLIQLFSTDFM